MKHLRHFGNATASREAMQTRTLIVDLERIVQIIDSDITSQEEQAGVSDRTHSEYPLLARVLETRRDNLRQTIVALEQRLSAAAGQETTFGHQSRDHFPGC